METSQILIVIGGIAILMILFKMLFGKNSHPNASLPAPIAEAGKRMGSVAKQAQMFAEVSSLLVNKSTLERDVPRIGTALFLAGAVDHLAQKAQMNDIEYMSVTSAIVQTAGLMTEGEADTFITDLPELSTTEFGRAAMMKGGHTIQAWLSGNDEMAPARLAGYVEEWSTIPASSI